MLCDSYFCPMNSNSIFTYNPYCSNNSSFILTAGNFISTQIYLQLKDIIFLHLETFQVFAFILLVFHIFFALNLTLLSFGNFLSEHLYLDFNPVISLWFILLLKASQAINFRCMALLLGLAQQRQEISREQFPSDSFFFFQLRFLLSDDFSQELPLISEVLLFSPFPSQAIQPEP